MTFQPPLLSHGDGRRRHGGPPHSQMPQPAGGGARTPLGDLEWEGAAAAHASKGASGPRLLPSARSLRHLRLETTICRYKEENHKGSAVGAGEARGNGTELWAARGGRDLPDELDEKPGATGRKMLGPAARDKTRRWPGARCPSMCRPASRGPISCWSVNLRHHQPRQLLSVLLPG